VRCKKKRQNLSGPPSEFPLARGLSRLQIETSKQESQAGTFRQDLFYRLNVVQIRLRPLLERKTDIALLVAHFLGKFSDPLEPVRAISDDALRRLILGVNG
jgi:transcriptional regulator of aromatic amino acid metabolism